MKKYILDILVVIFIAVLLFQGATNQFQKQDLREYQCYSLAFWQGNKSLIKFPDFCKFYLQKLPIYQPFHYLPNEYPLLAILPFSLGFIPLVSLPYEQSFCLWMIMIAAYIYILLRKFVSQSGAIYYALTLITAGWSTVAARFDIIPAAITFTAILLAKKKKWSFAMILIALGGCLKIYPFLLFPVFIIELWQDRKAKRTIPLLSFFITCCLILITSLFLNPIKTISPLTYLKNRPFQIESTWATLLWYLQLLGAKEKIIFSYGSLNIASKYSPIFYPLATTFTIIGLVTTYALQLRHRLNLINASILVILGALITAKVLSPQYLIWVIPLIPLLRKHTKETRTIWLIICLLTVFIFPFAYNNQNNFFNWKPDTLLQLTIAIRNSLLVFFVIRLYFTQQKLRDKT